MKYDIIKNNGVNSVKFIAEENEYIAGNGIYSIKIDENGREYVSVPNPKNPALNLFTDRIKDAVDSIMNGLGDVICSSRGNGFLDHDDVIMYIDREYGKSLKEKSKAGWKNARFCYSIKGGYQYSFNSPREVLNNGELLSIFDSDEERDNIITFNSSEEAKKKIKEFEEFASNKYKEFINSKSEEEEHNIFKSVPSIIHHLWNNFEKPDKYDNPGKFTLKVCQMIKR